MARQPRVYEPPDVGQAELAANLKSFNTVGTGVALAFVTPIALAAIGVLAGAAGPELMRGVAALALFIGLVQWVWLLPAAWVLHVGGRRETAKGLLIGGGVITLLQALCVGIGFLIFFGPGG